MIVSPRLWCAAAVLMGFGLTAAPALAADGTVTVHESTFNEFAGKIEPLRASGTRPVRQTIGICPFCVTITVCSGEWTVSVTRLNFDITPDNVFVTGQVSGTYNCTFLTIPWPAVLTAEVDVTYDAEDNVVLVETESAIVDVPILGARDFKDSLTLPPLPVSTALLHFETSQGPEFLRLSPRNITLEKKSGYLELEGDVILW